MNITIADRLVQLRKEHQYSQEELADQLHVSRQAVSKWERAEASPDTENLIALAKIYGVSLDYLLMGESPVIKEVPLEKEASSEFFPEVYTAECCEDDEDDEEDEEEDEEETSPRARRAKLLFALYPVVCALIYLLIGFFSGLWHPGWLVFITIPLVLEFEGCFTRGKPLRKALADGWPVLCVLLYLALGLFLGKDGWRLGWLVFLTIPLAEVLLRKW